MFNKHFSYLKDGKESQAGPLYYKYFEILKNPVDGGEHLEDVQFEYTGNTIKDVNSVMLRQPNTAAFGGIFNTIPQNNITFLYGCNANSILYNNGVVSSPPEFSFRLWNFDYRGLFGFVDIERGIPPLFNPLPMLDVAGFRNSNNGTSLSIYNNFNVVNYTNSFRYNYLGSGIIKLPYQTISRHILLPSRIDEWHDTSTINALLLFLDSPTFKNIDKICIIDYLSYNNIYAGYIENLLYWFNKLAKYHKFNNGFFNVTPDGFEIKVYDGSEHTNFTPDVVELPALKIKETKKEPTNVNSQYSCYRLDRYSSIYLLEKPDVFNNIYGSRFYKPNNPNWDTFLFDGTDYNTEEANKSNLINSPWNDKNFWYRIHQIWEFLSRTLCLYVVSPTKTVKFENDDYIQYRGTDSRPQLLPGTEVVGTSSSLAVRSNSPIMGFQGFTTYGAGKLNPQLSFISRSGYVEGGSTGQNIDRRPVSIYGDESRVLNNGYIKNPNPSQLLANGSGDFSLGYRFPNEEADYGYYPGDGNGVFENQNYAEVNKNNIGERGKLTLWGTEFEKMGSGEVLHNFDGAGNLSSHRISDVSQIFPNFGLVQNVNPAIFDYFTIYKQGIAKFDDPRGQANLQIKTFVVPSGSGEFKKYIIPVFSGEQFNGFHWEGLKNYSTAVNDPIEWSQVRDNYNSNGWKYSYTYKTQASRVSAGHDNSFIYPDLPTSFIGSYTAYKRNSPSTIPNGPLGTDIVRSHNTSLCGGHQMSILPEEYFSVEQATAKTYNTFLGNAVDGDGSISGTTPDQDFNYLYSNYKLRYTALMDSRVCVFMKYVGKGSLSNVIGILPDAANEDLACSSDYIFSCELGNGGFPLLKEMPEEVISNGYASCNYNYQLSTLYPYSTLAFTEYITTDFSEIDDNGDKIGIGLETWHGYPVGFYKDDEYIFVRPKTHTNGPNVPNRYFFSQDTVHAVRTVGLQTQTYGVWNPWGATVKIGWCLIPAGDYTPDKQNLQNGPEYIDMDNDNQQLTDFTGMHTLSNLIIDKIKSSQINVLHVANIDDNVPDSIFYKTLTDSSGNIIGHDKKLSDTVAYQDTYKYWKARNKTNTYKYTLNLTEAFSAQSEEDSFLCIVVYPDPLEIDTSWTPPNPYTSDGGFFAIGGDVRRYYSPNLPETSYFIDDSVPEQYMCYDSLIFRNKNRTPCIGEFSFNCISTCGFYYNTDIYNDISSTPQDSAIFKEMFNNLWIGDSYYACLGKMDTFNLPYTYLPVSMPLLYYSSGEFTRSPMISCDGQPNVFGSYTGYLGSTAMPAGVF